MKDTTMYQFTTTKPLILITNMSTLREQHVMAVSGALEKANMKANTPFDLIEIAMLELPRDLREDYSIFDDNQNGNAVFHIIPFASDRYDFKIQLGGGSFLFYGKEQEVGIYHQLRHDDGSLTIALFLLAGTYNDDTFDVEIDRAPERNEDS